MVRIKALYLIRSEDGLAIFYKPFGVVEHDQDRIASLLSAFGKFGKETFGEEAHLSQVRFKKVDQEIGIVMERGETLTAALVLSFLKQFTQDKETTIREQLQIFLTDVEKQYSKELFDPLLQKNAFIGVENLAFKHFYYDKLSPIEIKELEQSTLFTQNPENLVFELSPGGLKRYLFYQESPEFIEYLESIPKEVVATLLREMNDKCNVINYKNCLELLNVSHRTTNRFLFQFLVKKGIMRAFQVALY
ncbi:MAG: hypothetical protein ACFE95_02950 [Candidatus Hodarchaeota archaeon]